ncbi:MAG: FixH family protein [Acidobacteriota bacterium]
MKLNLRIYVGLGVLAVAALVLGACKSTPVVETKEIASHRANDLTISLLNGKGELAQGQNSFVIAFRNASDNKPVNVGTVNVSSSMSMPGMAPMIAPMELDSAGETGKYALKGDFGMSGAWKFEVRWDGPAGQGSTSFEANVR